MNAYDACVSGVKLCWVSSDFRGKLPGSRCWMTVDRTPAEQQSIVNGERASPSASGLDDLHTPHGEVPRQIVSRSIVILTIVKLI